MPRKKKETVVGQTEIVKADEKKLIEAQTESKEVSEFVASWAIRTQDEMDAAGELMDQCRVQREVLEAELKTITQPLRQAEQAARDKWNPPIKRFKEAEALLKEKIGKFELARMLEQREALRLIEESGGRAEADTLVVAHGHNKVELTGKATKTVKWKWRVVDEKLIDEKYWTRVLNESAIDFEVKLHKHKTDIPGIEVFEEIDIKHARRK